MIFRSLIIFLSTAASLETYADMRSEFEVIACKNLEHSASMYFNELLEICTNNYCSNVRPDYNVKTCRMTEWSDNYFKIRFEYERQAYPRGYYETLVTEKATSACYFNSSYKWQCLFDSTEFNIIHTQRKTKYTKQEAYPEHYQPRFNSAILEATEEYDL